jgi:RNA polymerase subunit RPABC4/transcription elongation factor Spt4
MMESKSEQTLECEECNAVAPDDAKECPECGRPWSDETKRHVSVSITMPEGLGGGVL